MGDSVNDGVRAPHAAILPSRNPAISRARGNHGVYRRPGSAHPGTQREDFLLPERFAGLARNADPCRAASPPHASGHGKRRLLKSPMPSSAGASPPCLASPPACTEPAGIPKASADEVAPCKSQHSKPGGSSHCGLVASRPILGEGP